MTVVNIRFLDRIRAELSSKRTKQKAGEQLIADMKDSISKGISPVRGVRRFVRYKDADKYPGGLKNKRPVNLFLSGDMLAALKFYPIGGTSFNVAIKGEQGVKAYAHNEGKGVPQRRFMPTAKDEKFTVTIERNLRDLYARIISDIIRRSR
jgi:hypothetical protein